MWKSFGTVSDNMRPRLPLIRKWSGRCRPEWTVCSSRWSTARLSRSVPIPFGNAANHRKFRSMSGNTDMQAQDAAFAPAYDANSHIANRGSQPSLLCVPNNQQVESLNIIFALLHRCSQPRKFQLGRVHRLQHAVMQLPSPAAQYVSSVIAYQFSHGGRKVGSTEVGELRCRAG